MQIQDFSQIICIEIDENLRRLCHFRSKGDF